MGYRFTWNDRLHLQRDFSTVIRQGRRISASGIVVWIYRYVPAERGPRMGLAIPRTYGNAVARNRLKRLLREVFRLNKALLPPGVDMVFSARKLSFEPTYQRIEPVVKSLWAKAGLEASL